MGKNYTSQQQIVDNWAANVTMYVYVFTEGQVTLMIKV